MSTIEDVDNVEEMDISKSPPFVVIDGIVNLRDALAAKPSAGFEGYLARPSYLYRSGAPTGLTDQGKAQFVELGIKKVFDLRLETEVMALKASRLEVDGVEVVPCPIQVDKDKDEAYDPRALGEKMPSLDDVTFTKLYLQFAEAGGAPLKVILEHVRDHGDQPCLIHCTAGKDRTGVFVALIQLLVGMGKDDIVNDYTLTTYGVRSMLPILVQQLKGDEDRAKSLVIAKGSTFQAFLEAFEKRYETVERYIKEKTLLDDDDIKRIRENLLMPASER